MKLKQLGSALLVLGVALGLSGPASAATGHEGHGAAGVEMKLDNGRKWQTDAPLRQGMGEIRVAIAAALPRIHEGRFAAADYVALGERVQQQLDYVVANCKLPEEADLQLHIALAKILEGIGALKEPSGQVEGVLAIVAALAAYGEHFDHPGWQPLAH
jgi:hypothetical protein